MCLYAWRDTRYIPIVEVEHATGLALGVHVCGGGVVGAVRVAGGGGVGRGGRVRGVAIMHSDGAVIGSLCRDGCVCVRVCACVCVCVCVCVVRVCVFDACGGGIPGLVQITSERACPWGSYHTLVGAS